GCMLRAVTDRSLRVSFRADFTLAGRLVGAFGSPPCETLPLRQRNTRGLSLRRTPADCGNPRERKDRRDRDVASLLPYNTRCHCEGGLPTAAIQAGIRWIATSLRS